MEQTLGTSTAPLTVQTANPLAAFNPSAMGIVQQDDSQFAGLSSEFLPRIMLMQPGSGPVSAGNAKLGDFVVVEGDKDKPRVLGTQFDGFLIHARPKALYLEGSTVVEDVYDVNDAVFQRIRSTPNEDDSANLFGVEFLIWLLKEKMFVTYFYSNPTARKQIGATRSLMGKQATWASKIIKSKGKTWAGPIVANCCSTYAEGPSEDGLKLEIGKFQQPPTKKREAAPAKKGGDDNR
jgi:hypothetical protein